MAVFNGMFPIIAGKEESGARLRKGVHGSPPRGVRGAAAEDRTRRETWSSNQTPMGNFMLVWFDYEGGDEVFEVMAASDDEFTVWFRGQVLEITGVDMTDPEGPPPPEVLVDWSA